MKKVMSGCGTVVGIAGELVCLAAVAGRFWGSPSFLGHKAASVFLVGVGLMVLGCFKKLWVIEYSLGESTVKK